MLTQGAAAQKDVTVDGEELATALQDSRFGHFLSSYISYRSTRPLAIRLELPTKDSTEDELDEWLASRNEQTGALDVKEFRIDISDILLPENDLPNTVWFLLHQTGNVSQLIAPQLKTDGEKFFLIVDAFSLFDLEDETEEFPTDRNEVLQMTLVGYQSDHPLTKEYPAPIGRIDKA